MRRTRHINRQYEKLKAQAGEYDVADVTAHLHAQLAAGGYRGSPFRFVYIDEVQDLTPAQIGLFRCAAATAAHRSEHTYIAAV